MVLRENRDFPPLFFQAFQLFLEQREVSKIGPRSFDIKLVGLFFLPCNVQYHDRMHSFLLERRKVEKQLIRLGSLSVGEKGLAIQSLRLKLKAVVAGCQALVTDKAEEVMSSKI
ncbi:hypothetical protein SDC9_82037 [bioreactor metagenome]|uniref:Uncharacterized protein n=1 Tax=bioreactor metagenome TaxID=1076179 RepID=A0A644Z3G2_9ZZZZ